MPRNLDRRIEVLTPVLHPKHRAWLDRMFELLLADDVPAFELCPDDRWERIGPRGFEPHPQRRMYEWVSHTQTQTVRSSA
jgi:polyphosphate kinase